MKISTKFPRINTNFERYQSQSFSPFVRISNIPADNETDKRTFWKKEAKDARSRIYKTRIGKARVLISGLANDLTHVVDMTDAAWLNKPRSARPDLIFRSDTRLKELQGISGVAECVAKSVARRTWHRSTTEALSCIWAFVHELPIQWTLTSYYIIPHTSVARNFLSRTTDFSFLFFFPLIFFSFSLFFSSPRGSTNSKHPTEQHARASAGKWNSFYDEHICYHVWGL